MCFCGSYLLKYVFSSPEKKRTMSAPQIIALGFLAIIFVGGLLLSFPISSADKAFTPFSDSLFTAVSATCVTGLTTVSTLTHWSAFGKGLILLLIQIGGLGFMAMAFMVSLVVRRSVTPREKLIFAQSMNLPTNGSLTSFLKYMVRFAFTVEGAGALLLSFPMCMDFGFPEGIVKAVFHSVSAFCNAGFDTMPTPSLTSYADNVYVNAVIICLVVSGGLGFIVWREISELIHKKKPLSLYSRLVITITAILIFGGALFYLVCEWSNPDTLGDCSFGSKMIRSLFQSITTRTAGFNSINMDKLTPLSKFGTLLLMFIGGSPGSTAGGIKTVTIGIVLISVFNIARGRSDIDLCRRQIDRSNVLRAFALTSLALTLVGIGTVLVYAFDGNDLLDSAFEVVSAFGTVGLSTGMTASLGLASRIVLMILMFSGRVGLFTVSFATLVRINRDRAIKYPTANILIG